MDNLSYRNNRPLPRPESETPRVPAEPAVAPAPIAPQTDPPVAPARTKHSQPAKKAPKRRLPILIGAGAALLVVVLLALFFTGKLGGSAGVDSSRYQAVFFTNGQVYFGKLSTLNDDYLSLKNVYYLQTKSSGNTTDATPQSASKQDASDVELIKLGNEIHGPDDQMIIARDQVLFFENLKPAGTVSQTITNYQKQKK